MTFDIHHSARRSSRALFPLLIFMILFLACSNTGFSWTDKSTYAIIPAPVSLVPMDGRFPFSPETRILVSPLDSDTKLAAEFLARLVKNPTGLTVPVEEGSAKRAHAVCMSLDPSLHEEGYVLSVAPQGITIRAGSAVGLFYAVQTIRQLLPVEVERPAHVKGLVLSVPACEIKDQPQFVYRGMHLDVGRHMFPVSCVKKYIDMIAMHKMNTFHWHLTEDQGWRIEIKKYPRLTTLGGFRKETLVGSGNETPQVFDGKPYGGFYTPEEIKDIVAYARSKFVTIVPEIEMPGHSTAALAAYPELSCTGGPFEVATKWGVFPDVYCAGKESTFRFLEDVLSEVIDLFPGTYLHIGGDECPKDRWQKCPACQKRMKDEGIRDEKGLQSYFIARIEKFLIAKGKKLIGWDEILEGGLAPEATVMSWRGTDGGIDAAKQHHDVIMSPYEYVYLHCYQAAPEGLPLAPTGTYLPLEKVYSFNPLPSALTTSEQKYVLGLEGCFWSEFVGDPGVLEYMVYPRMFAIAETGWTPASQKDFDGFLARFAVAKRRYDALGIRYFKGEYRNIQAKKNEH